MQTEHLIISRKGEGQSERYKNKKGIENNKERETREKDREHNLAPLSLFSIDGGHGVLISFFHSDYSGPVL